MSNPWRITRGDQMFTAKDVAELKLMAVGGKIEAGDLVQPPGRTDWLYASEVGELKGLIKFKQVDEELFIQRKPAKLLKRIVGVVGIMSVGLGFTALYQSFLNRPDITKTALFGDHEGALGPLEGLATQHANMLAEPDSGAAKIGEMPKDARVSLISKMGDFYEVDVGGTKGFVGMRQVVPAYLFSQELMDKYDPLFNPDQYLQLLNYSWVPSGEPGEEETLTHLMFEIQNPTDYGMLGVTLKVTFEDGQGQELGVKNIEIPRLLPPGDELFLSNIEVDIEWDDETAAEVKIFGARALLADEYSKLKAEEEKRLEAEAFENAGKEPVGMVIE
jgi:hypothetical protein